MANSGETQKHRSPVNIISVDIGTTTISCHHLDESGISVYQTSRKVRKIIAHSQLDFTLQSRRKHDLCLSTFLSFEKAQMKNFQSPKDSCSSKFMPKLARPNFFDYPADRVEEISEEIGTI